MLPSRFLLLACCFILAGCAGYAALVLGSATWEEARALDRLFPFYDWHIRPFTAADQHQLRRLLALVAGGLTTLALTLGLTPAGRRDLARLGAETSGAVAGLGRALARLSGAERRLAAGLLGLLTAARVYFSLTNPAYDDAVSYEIFVRKGLLAVAGYYPIPNNHVFSNTISWLFYQLHPGFWFSMRLPVLLLSTAGTGLLYAALLRRAGFRVATVALTGFGWLQLSLYHAAVGRGYWLLTTLAALVFFCTLALTNAPKRPYAAWTGLLVGGILGCYTIPIFAYVLASAFSWLGFGFLQQRAAGQLARLVAVGVAIIAGTLILYSPLLLISGAVLVGNGFVAPRAPDEFWRGFAPFIWYTEGFLAGQRTIGAALTLVVLALLGWMRWLARAGRLAAGLRRPLRELGGPALWFVAFPYAVLSVQHVFPPERVFLYKGFFLYILVGLVWEWISTTWPRPAYHRLRVPALLLVLLYAGYQYWSIERGNVAYRASNASYRNGLAWLARQPPGPILIPEPTHNLFFRFYAHTLTPGRTWHFDDAKVDSVRYAYVVAFPNQRGLFQPPISFPPAYRNADVEIYVLPPAAH